MKSKETWYNAMKGVMRLHANFKVPPIEDSKVSC
jgi:hypothetical protein